VAPALRIADLRNFDPDPHFYNYPSLQIYLLSGWIYLSALLGGSIVWPHHNLPSPIDAIYLARWATALFGLATVATVYCAGAMAGSRRIGVLAAILLTVTPLHALDSHYANVDIPMAFWVMLSTCFALKYLQSNSGKWFFLAAISVGLAGATKYTALAMAATLPAIGLLGGGGKTSRVRHIGLAAAGPAIALIAFLIASPYTLINHESVSDAISFEREHMQSGHWGWDLSVGGWINQRVVYHFAAGLPFALGLPQYLMAICGGLAVLRRPSRNWVALGAAILPILALVLWAKVVFPRYLIPCIPFCALAAARAADSLLSADRPGVRRFGYILFASTVAYTAVLTISQLIALSPQNSTEASKWIVRNVPPGSLIAVAEIEPMLVIPKDRFRLETPFDLQGVMSGRTRPEWIVVSSWYSTAWERGTRKGGDVDRFLDSLGGPESDYRISASFESRYLNESLYGFLDPYFKNQFESPDFTIYRRRSPR
jgi:hypothetical protein